MIEGEIKHSYYVTFNISTDHTHTDVKHIPCDNFVLVEDDYKKKIRNRAHNIAHCKIKKTANQRVNYSIFVFWTHTYNTV